MSLFQNCLKKDSVQRMRSAELPWKHRSTEVTGKPQRMPTAITPSSVEAAVPAGDIHISASTQSTNESNRYYLSDTPKEDRGSAKVPSFRPKARQTQLSPPCSAAPTPSAEGGTLSADKGSLNLDTKRECIRRTIEEQFQREHGQALTIPKLGESRNRPSHEASEATRLFRDTPSVREPPAPQEASQRARQACRFQEKPGQVACGRSRSLTPGDGQWRQAYTSGRGSKTTDSPAGIATSDRRRHDGDTATRTRGTSEVCSLGQGKTGTPRYHQRYSENLVGTSLPASLPCEANEVAPAQRRPLSQVGVFSDNCSESRHLTPSNETRDRCRFHSSKNDFKKQFSCHRSQDDGMSILSAVHAQHSPRGVDENVGCRSAKMSGRGTKPPAAVKAFQQELTMLSKEKQPLNVS